MLRHGLKASLMTFNAIAWLSIALACLTGLGALYLAGRLLDRP